MPRPAVTAENFLNRVRKGTDDQCWQWTEYRSKGRKAQAAGGYGRVDAFGLKGVYVHRLAYCLSNRGLELKRVGELIVRHTCDNPICCNPKHLVLGTHADNMRDMVERGRSPRKMSIASANAKLSAAEVRAIRERSAAGATRKELAERYGVSIQTIKAVRSGRHYKDVT